MRLKDLEKFKLIEAALMFGIPLGLIIFNNNPSVNDQTASWGEKLLNNSNNWYVKLSVIPRLVDIMLPTRIEFKTDDYKEIKNLYDKIINNLVSFFEEQNISDPVEIFTIYQFMYRNGYLSFNHNFNYDIDMKDLSRLNGTDLIRSTGVCKIITSFLTDVYKKMDYDSCNYFVKKIAKVISIMSIPNYLITCLEYKDYVYIFDPTNDAF